MSTPGCNTPGSAGECAGCFGKVPALGDFLTRDLPASFVDPWDKWLSVELAEAQLLLGEAWTKLWHEARPCCFSLGPYLVDERYWSGVLVPSRDRVGREFPLTIAFGRSRAGDITSGAWWHALLETAHRAIEARDADAVGSALANFINGEAPLRVALDSSYPATSEQPREESSIWWAWSEAGDDRQPNVQRFAALPQGGEFRKLLALETRQP